MRKSTRMKPLHHDKVTPVDTKWVDTGKAFEGEPMKNRSRIVAREFKSADRPGLHAGTPSSIGGVEDRNIDCSEPQRYFLNHAHRRVTCILPCKGPEACADTITCGGHSGCRQYLLFYIFFRIFLHFLHFLKYLLTLFHTFHPFYTFLHPSSTPFLYTFLNTFFAPFSHPFSRSFSFGTFDTLVHHCTPLYTFVLLCAPLCTVVHRCTPFAHLLYTFCTPFVHLLYTFCTLF